MTVADIIISPALVYHAPVAEPLPDDSTVAYGVDWAGNWTALTYTKTPLTMSREISTVEVMVEQSINPLKRFATEERIKLETELAELIPANLLLLMEGTVTNTPQAAGQTDFDQLDAGGEFNITERQWGFEGKYINAAGDILPVRLFIHRATSVLNGNLVFGKGEQTGIPLLIEALADTGKTAGEQMFSMQVMTLPGI